MSSIVSDARAMAAELVKIRRHLHQIPEFGLQLPKTQQFVLSQIRDLGEITLGKKLSSIVLLIDSGKPGPTVILRSDMDALAVIEEAEVEYRSANGFMHACGHDLHMAAAIGAAKLLSARKQQWRGKVSIWFQPGEEGHGGADMMIEEGALEIGADPVASYGLHVFSSMPLGVFAGRAGALMASASGVVVTVKGQGGHGSMPWLAKDPIIAAVSMIASLQDFVAKKLSPLQPVIINVGWVKAGDESTTNVIPETARFGATIRTFSDESLEQVRDLLPAHLDSIAKTHEVSVSHHFDPASMVVNNNPENFELSKKVAIENFGADRFSELENPMTGGEDFSSILKRIPGNFIFLGACPEDVDYETAPTNHSTQAVFDDVVIADGAAWLASMALEHLAD